MKDSYFELLDSTSLATLELTPFPLNEKEKSYYISRIKVPKNFEVKE